MIDHSRLQVRRLPGHLVPGRGPAPRRAVLRRARIACLAAVLLAAALAPNPAAAAADRLPHRALWIEVSANLRTLASREAIRSVVQRARASGIDTLIPEAKNAWGFVIYESAFAPHIRTSPVSRPGYPPPVE